MRCNDVFERPLKEKKQSLTLMLCYVIEIKDKNKVQKVFNTLDCQIKVLAEECCCAKPQKNNNKSMLLPIKHVGGHA